MASVLVYSQAKVDELTDEAVVSAVIDGSRHLLLTTQGGTVIDLGAIPTATQGAKADAARPNVGAVVNISAGDTTATGTMETVTVTDDGSDTNTWLNRMAFMFKDAGVGAVARFTSFFNEYGELRIAPGKLNTVALRVFTKDTPTNPAGSRSTTVPVFEIMDNRTDRNSLWSIMGSGTVFIKGTIPTASVLVLAAAASVPAGTPSGTVIVRLP